MTVGVQTVLGPVDASSLGCILPHEHTAVYRAYSSYSPSEDSQAQVLAHMTPMYRRLREEFDCQTIVDATPIGMGRDVRLLQRVARATGMNIVCATGYYTSIGRPEDFEQKTAPELAEKMIREIVVGVDGTKVRAGIIKLAVGKWNAADRMLCKAAALAQQETGCTITTHTCSPSDRRGVLDFLEGAGVPPERICLGHADDNATTIESLELVRRGCNLLYTIWGIQDPQPIGWRLPALPKYHSAELVATMVAEGYRDQVMMSIDYAPFIDQDGSLDTSHLYGVEGRTSLYMFTHVLGWLRDVFHLDQSTLQHIMCDNPRRSLMPR